MTALFLYLICFKFEVSIIISSWDIKVYDIGHPVFKRSLSIKVQTEQFGECFRTVIKGIFITQKKNSSITKGFVRNSLRS